MRSRTSHARKGIKNPAPLINQCDLRDCEDPRGGRLRGCVRCLSLWGVVMEGDG